MNLKTDELIEVPAGRARLEGMLAIPQDAHGVVVFAHGSGSGRMSPRNQYVAGVLREHGLGTLLIDLLEEDEAENRAKVFDIDLLSDRLLAATDWLTQDERTRDFQIGYFGASTGAAAALQAAAKKGLIVGAVVSRGGRPDLAMDYLPQVKSPTLLIVGGDDYPVIALNEKAYALLPGPRQMVIIPGATHLFEEPGMLERVADYAQAWFNKYLKRWDQGEAED